MPSTDYLDHLAQVRLFSSCNSKELAKIARASDELSLPKGKVLMNQGRTGREAFVIVDGQASVDVGGVTVAELGPGDHVGELALLDGGTRTATVTATTDMTVIVLSQRAFFGLLDEVPGLARKILSSLAGMIRDLDEQLAPHA
ncbi:MAG: cyclic nucleotide-binding domain-containing protein [Microthrixaceae bacterium]|nr:cyclic nucleotide-binding domain-containing protein [Microthrixaceae bacterium]